VPERISAGGKVVAFEDMRLTVKEFEKLKLMVVGNKAKPVGLKIPANLSRLRECTERGPWRLNLDRAPLRKLTRKGFVLCAAYEREETSISQTRTMCARMGLKMDARFETLADSVQEVSERSIEGSLSCVGAERMRGTHRNDVLLDDV
jgi:hypothetical protein